METLPDFELVLTEEEMRLRPIKAPSPFAEEITIAEPVKSNTSPARSTTPDDLPDLINDNASSDNGAGTHVTNKYSTSGTF